MSRAHDVLRGMVAALALGSVVFAVPISWAQDNLPPTANAGVGVTARPGDVVALDGSASFDPEAMPLAFAWAQTGGPGVVLINSSSVLPNVYVPANIPAGTQLTFRLTVTDNANQTSSDIVVVTVTAPAALIDTVVGNGTAAYLGDGLVATATGLTPAAVAIDASGNLYIAAGTSHAVYKVAAQGNVISTVTTSGCGTGAVATTLQNAAGIAVAPSGEIYVSDSNANHVCRISSDYTTVSVYAGFSTGSAGVAGDGGPATSAGLQGPRGLALDSSGNLYIADATNHRIRMVDRVTGNISTKAGMLGGAAAFGFSGDGGPATAARLNLPVAVALDAIRNIYISDSNNNRIRRVDSGGTITTIAGSPVSTFSGDLGPATSAGLLSPSGVALDALGNIYIGDSGHGRVRKIVKAAGNIIDTVAGTGGAYSGDGGDPLQAGLSIASVAESNGLTLYATDSTHFRVRRLTGVMRGLDTTAPVITPAITGTVGLDGWYTGPVTLIWNYSDPDSPITSTSGCGAQNSGPGFDADSPGVTSQCTVTSGGGTAVRSVTIKRDATPPTASAAAISLPNTNGWYNGNVTVRYSGTDATSGVGPCTSDSVLMTEGANQPSAPGTCVDNAGNVSNSAVATGINIDKTAPAVSASAAPLPGASGWNTSTLTVSFSGLDALSGIDACSPPVLWSTNGSGQSVSGGCTDRAGNVGQASVTGINIDSTVPTAAATLNPAANANGWNNSDVTVSFAGADSLPGSGLASCTPDVLFTLAAAGQTTSGTCADVAGNVSAPAFATVNIDKTAPGVSITTPVHGDNYAVGQSVGAAYTCTDSLSGIAAGDCAGNVAPGSALDTSAVGPGALTVTGTDRAGNATVRSSAFQTTDAATQARLTRVDYEFTPTAVIGGFPEGVVVRGVAYIDQSAPDASPGTSVGSYRLYSSFVDVGGQLVLPAVPTAGGSLQSDYLLQDQVLTNPVSDRLQVSTSVNLNIGSLNIYAVNVALEGPESILSGDALVIPDPSAFTYSQLGYVSFKDQAGNYYAVLGALSSLRFTPLKPDTTAPTISSSVVGTLGDNNWYRSDVTVNWTVTDPESAIASQSGCSSTTVNADTSSTTLTCEATSHGGTTTHSVTVKRDTVAPITNAAPSPLPNANGWNNTNVAVTFSGTDATSGIATCSSATVVTTDGQGQTSGSGTCTDNAGNVSAATSASGINIDRTPPVVTGTAAPAPNGGGWNNTAVTVSFTGADGLSGVAAGGCAAPLTLSANGSGQSAAGTCADRAGNVGSATVTPINIDTSAPSVTATATPAPNANGWNAADVTVTFAGTDSLSGSGVASCSPAQTLTSQGAGQLATGSCQDVAGNSASASATANIDKTPPLAAVAVPAANASYSSGATVNAAYSCSDAPSGVVTCAGTVANGLPIDTTGTGVKSFTLNAVDRAGNAATTTVTYSVTGSPAQWSVSPASLAFGPQGLSATSPGMTVTVSNPTGNAIVVNGITLAGTNPAQFAQTSTCAGSVAAGGSCMISVTFRPTTIGAKSAVLNVTAAGGLGTRSVALSGTGVRTAVAVSPASLNFGNVGLTSTSTLSVVVTNVGLAPVPSSNLSIAGTNVGQFAQTSTCASLLPVGNSCTVNVSFTPSGAGSKSASLRIAPLGGATVTAVALTGTGVAPAYTVTPAQVDFGSTPRNTQGANQYITVSITGTWGLPLTTINLVGLNPGQFKMTNNCPARLELGNCVVEVRFMPTSTGIKRASLRVAPGNGIAPQLVSLTGIGL
jgi:hypothetical protein